MKYTRRLWNRIQRVTENMGAIAMVLRQAVDGVEKYYTDTHQSASYEAMTCMGRVRQFIEDADYVQAWDDIARVAGWSSASTLPVVWMHLALAARKMV